MPTYQYACQDCGYRFDIRQRISDDPLTECPECHGAIHRVISPVGIIFKGSGFYVTDNKNGSKNYANGNKRDEAKNGNGAKTENTATNGTNTKATEGKKESTPSTKTEKATP